MNGASRCRGAHGTVYSIPDSKGTRVRKEFSMHSPTPGPMRHLVANAALPRDVSVQIFKVADKSVEMAEANGQTLFHMIKSRQMNPPSMDERKALVNRLVTMFHQLETHELAHRDTFNIKNIVVSVSKPGPLSRCMQVTLLDYDLVCVQFPGVPAPVFDQTFPNAYSGWGLPYSDTHAFGLLVLQIMCWKLNLYKEFYPNKSHLPFEQYTRSLDLASCMLCESMPEPGTGLCTKCTPFGTLCNATWGWACAVQPADERAAEHKCKRLLRYVKEVLKRSTWRAHRHVICFCVFARSITETTLNIPLLRSHVLAALEDPPRPFTSVMKSFISVPAFTIPRIVLEPTTSLREYVVPILQFLRRLPLSCARTSTILSVFVAMRIIDEAGLLTKFNTVNEVAGYAIGAAWQVCEDDLVSPRHSSFFQTWSNFFMLETQNITHVCSALIDAQPFHNVPILTMWWRQFEFPECTNLCTTQWVINLVPDVFSAALQKTTWADEEGSGTMKMCKTPQGSARAIVILALVCATRLWNDKDWSLRRKILATLHTNWNTTNILCAP